MIQFRKFPPVISHKDTQKIRHFIDTYPEYTEQGNKYIIFEEIEGDPFAVLAGKDCTFGFSNGEKVLEDTDEYRGWNGMMSSPMGQYLMKNLAVWVGKQTANIEAIGVIPKDGKYAPAGRTPGFYITDIRIDNQLVSSTYAGEGLISNGLASFYVPTVWICEDINEALLFDKAEEKDSLIEVKGFTTPKMYGTRIKPYNFQQLSDKKEPLHIVQQFDRESSC